MPAPASLTGFTPYPGKKPSNSYHVQTSIGWPTIEGAVANVTGTGYTSGYIVSYEDGPTPLISIWKDQGATHTIVNWSVDAKCTSYVPSTSYGPVTIPPVVTPVAPPVVPPPAAPVIKSAQEEHPERWQGVLVG